MKIGFPKESFSKEVRISLLPQIIQKYVQLDEDISICVQRGLGESCHISDEKFEEAGAVLIDSTEEILSSCDLICRFRKPTDTEISQVKNGAIYIGHLEPFSEKELINKMANSQITSVSMEMIPRTTLAQKMDSLSSQASLAGYVMVITAAEKIQKVFPMMMTPAGTISPAKVLIIGAGVAGLQAIATAKRLGAKVEAFDTRPVVKEQVESLGAKFIEIDLGETGQTDQGYAKELTPDQLETQRLALKKHCSNSDIVITTAQLFGRKAPLIVTQDMVEAMKPGSVIVDLAVESGGNVAGSKIDEEVDFNGVKIIGFSNFPGKVALDASLMYAQNLFNLIKHFWNKEEKKLDLNLEDEILKNCVLTHQGQVLREF